MHLTGAQRLARATPRNHHGTRRNADHPGFTREKTQTRRERLGKWASKSNELGSNPVVNTGISKKSEETETQRACFPLKYHRFSPKIQFPQTVGEPQETQSWKRLFPRRKDQGLHGLPWFPISSKTQARSECLKKCCVRTLQACPL